MIGWCPLMSDTRDHRLTGHFLHFTMYFWRYKLWNIISSSQRIILRLILFYIWLQRYFHEHLVPKKIHQVALLWQEQEHTLFTASITLFHTTSIIIFTYSSYLSLSNALLLQLFPIKWYQILLQFVAANGNRPGRRSAAVAWPDAVHRSRFLLPPLQLFNEHPKLPPPFIEIPQKAIRFPWIPITLDPNLLFW